MARRVWQKARMRSDLPSWLTEQKLDVLREVGSVLARLDVPWMAAGGLAGNLWGSTWPLHDIDIDMPADRLAELAAIWAPFVVWQGRWVDHEFDIDLLRLNFDGVEVDLSGADGGFYFTPSGERRPFPDSLARRTPRALATMVVPCQRLEDLIDYKTGIGRDADVQDLRRLLPLPPI